MHLEAPGPKVRTNKFKTECRVVTAIAPTSDGRYLLIGGKPGRVTMYEILDSKLIPRAAFDFEIGDIYSLAVSPDGLTAAVAGGKGLIVFDIEHE